MFNRNREILNYEESTLSKSEQSEWNNIIDTFTYHPSQQNDNGSDYEIVQHYGSEEEYVDELEESDEFKNQKNYNEHLLNQDRFCFQGLRDSIDFSDVHQNYQKIKIKNRYREFSNDEESNLSKSEQSEWNNQIDTFTYHPSQQNDDGSDYEKVQQYGSREEDVDEFQESDEFKNQKNYNEHIQNQDLYCFQGLRDSIGSSDVQQNQQRQKKERKCFKIKRVLNSKNNFNMHEKNSNLQQNQNVNQNQQVQQQNQPQQIMKFSIDSKIQEYQKEFQLISLLEQYLLSQKCKFCQKKMKKDAIQAHEEQCLYKEEQYDEIQCPYCGDIIIRPFLKDHFEECDLYYQDQFLKLEGIKECSICMNQVTENKYVLKCQHQFHFYCIKEWVSIKKVCPICRSEIFDQII